MSVSQVIEFARAGDKSHSLSTRFKGNIGLGFFRRNDDHRRFFIAKHHEYPATRPVFDRYGLRGCGGPKGPHETVWWFSRLHGVSLEKLLSELNAAASVSAPVCVETGPSRGDTIFRPFFLAGIAVVFSLGCLWDAVTLWIMGHNRAFGSVNYSWVLAHADAMVFRFVDFFIMGFAYQALPRFKHSALWRPGLGYITPPLMAVGICMQTLAHLFAPQSSFMALGIARGLLIFLAVVIFSVVLAVTLRNMRTSRNPTIVLSSHRLRGFLWRH